VSGEWKGVGKCKQKQNGQTANKNYKSERSFFENDPKAVDICTYHLSWITCNSIRQMHFPFSIIIEFLGNNYQDMQCFIPPVHGDNMQLLQTPSVGKLVESLI
jgi:hypothetical protein